MKTKIEPKLKFEVGEEVVICGASASWSGNDHYPNLNDFTFTTIKEVLEDGSVIVEEGYKFRQSYETHYGYTEVHNYFKINKAKEKTTFNGKHYFKSNNRVSVEDYCVFWYGPVFLYKEDGWWQHCANEIEKEYKAWSEEHSKAMEAKAIKEAKESPFKEAFNNEYEVLKKEFDAKVSEIWKKHRCASCKHNKNGYCHSWQTLLENESVSICSAWEVE